MKKNISILLALTITLFCGCTSESDSETSTTVTVHINAVERALSSSDTGEFKDGTQIGVYMTTASAGLAPSGNHIHNIAFTAAASKFSAIGVNFPVAIDKFDFFAYAPYSPLNITLDKQLAFSIKQDQSVTTESSDLLWATQKSSLFGAVGNLVFGHKLSRIKVTLKAGIGVTLSSPSVNISGTLPSVKLNMETGALSAAEGEVAPITATNIDINEKYTIIVPQTVMKDTEFISVTNNGRTYTYKLLDNRTFAPNTEYLFDITVDRNDINVSFTGSIDGWITGDTTTGSAI